MPVLGASAPPVDGIALKYTRAEKRLVISKFLGFRTGIGADNPQTSNVFRTVVALNRTGGKALRINLRHVDAVLLLMLGANFLGVWLVNQIDDPKHVFFLPL